MNETLYPARRGGRLGRTAVRSGAVAGVALAVAITAAGCGSSGGGSATTATTNPNAVAATRADLGALGISLQQPIFWIGPMANRKLEQTSTGDGRVLVRYLPRTAKIGTNTPYLTVGTYAVTGAYAAAQRAASKPGAVRLSVTTNAIAFSTKSHPLNAWITYPGSHFQIEVFDPTPGQRTSARHLRQGRPRPGQPDREPSGRRVGEEPRARGHHRPAPDLLGRTAAQPDV